MFCCCCYFFFANLKNSVNLNSASKCCWKSKLWTPIARLVCCVGASSVCIILVTPSQQNQTVSLNSQQPGTQLTCPHTHTQTSMWWMCAMRRGWALWVVKRTPCLFFARQGVSHGVVWPQVLIKKLRFSAALFFNLITLLCRLISYLFLLGDSIYIHWLVSFVIFCFCFIIVFFLIF